MSCLTSSAASALEGQGVRQKRLQVGNADIEARLRGDNSTGWRRSRPGRPFSSKREGGQFVPEVNRAVRGDIPQEIRFVAVKASAPAS